MDSLLYLHGYGFSTPSLAGFVDKSKNFGIKILHSCCCYFVSFKEKMNIYLGMLILVYQIDSLACQKTSNALNDVLNVVIYQRISNAI